MTAQPVKPAGPSGQPTGQNGPARGPYKLMNKKKTRAVASGGGWSQEVVECLIFLKSLPYSATVTLIPSFLSHSLLLLLHHPRFGKPEESTLVSPPPTSLAKKHEGRVQAIHGVSFLLHRDIHHVAGRGSSATIGLRLTNDFDRHDHHEHSCCHFSMGNCFSEVTAGRAAIGGTAGDFRSLAGAPHDAVENFLRSRGHHGLFSQIELSFSASGLGDRDVLLKVRFRRLSVW
ncbi:hypothetical protein DEO72_LG5g2411 [Vigna unguiculata]|uniref:Uncharacterized protein n=1 Tax=Vigna unguiculata TaxID=3917 RepID=A0A4D6M167_VIGUN|nr:hypothetical protein DEO72_LG5g2411 [Vigna unguiculata]